MPDPMHLGDSLKALPESLIKGQHGPVTLLKISRPAKRNALDDDVIASIELVEAVIPEGAAFDLWKWIDLRMLVLAGGRERTETEYRALLSAAGFDLQEVVASFPAPTAALPV